MGLRREAWDRVVQGNDLDVTARVVGAGRDPRR